MAKNRAEYMKEYRENNPGKAYENTKRWREKHPELRYEGKKRYYQKTINSVNSKCRYTVEEIEMILKHEIPDSELSKELGRSVGSIQHVRNRYKDKYEIWNGIHAQVLAPKGTFEKIFNDLESEVEE
jgi:hypothetical protein